MGFFQRWMYRLQQFMIGRYGLFDAFSKFLAAVYLVIAVLMMFVYSPALRVANSLLLIYIFYRLLSKNIVKRQQEEQKFLQISNRVTGKIRLYQRIRKDKGHKYFTCPSCKSTLRIPRPAKHKKIELHCTKCGNKFIKKV